MHLSLLTLHSPESMDVHYPGNDKMVEFRASDVEVKVDTEANQTLH